MGQKILASLIGIALAFIIDGCGFFHPSASDIISRVQTAQANIHTLYAVWQETTAQPDGRGVVVTVHYWFQEPGSFRYSLEEKNAPPVLTVSNGNILWNYNQADNTYTVAPLAQSVAPDPFSAPADLPARLDKILGRDQVNFLGASSVANRPAYGLQITSTDGNVSILWIDQSNYQPLRYLASLPDGSTVELNYLVFQPNVPVDNDLFNFSPPAGATLSFNPNQETAPKPITLQDAGKTTGFRFLSPQGPLPPGMSIVGLSQLSDLEGGIGSISMYLQDASGQSVLVTESAGPAPGAEGPWASLWSGDPNQAGGPYHVLPGPDKGSPVILSFVKDGTLVIISGAPQTEALEIANSLNDQ